MLIIRRLNCTAVASSIVPLSKWLSGATGRPITESEDIRFCISTIQPPDDEYTMLEKYTGL